MNDQLSYNKQLFIKQFFSYFISTPFFWIVRLWVYFHSVHTNTTTHSFITHLLRCVRLLLFLSVRSSVRKNPPEKKNNKKSQVPFFVALSGSERVLFVAASWFFFFFLRVPRSVSFLFTNRRARRVIQDNVFLGFVNIFRSFIIIYYFLLLFFLFCFVFLCVRCAPVEKETK